jgi:hypothetical protein
MKAEVKMLETSIKVDLILKKNLLNHYLKKSETMRIVIRKLYNNPDLSLSEKYQDNKNKYKLIFPVNIVIEEKYENFDAKKVRAYLREKFANMLMPIYKFDI